MSKKQDKIYCDKKTKRWTNWDLSEAIRKAKIKGIKEERERILKIIDEVLKQKSEGDEK